MPFPWCSYTPFLQRGKTPYILPRLTPSIMFSFLQGAAPSITVYTNLPSVSVFYISSLTLLQQMPRNLDKSLLLTFYLLRLSSTAPLLKNVFLLDFHFPFPMKTISLTTSPPATACLPLVLLHLTSEAQHCRNVTAFSSRSLLC